ncbi:IclR family transcriptional regulator [Saccharopolyspora oryzae]|uniref:IclR family transcriptional regulator n=1 Tax=Saccharopolyspora oryzae TaxID=2997343 RepID=A0ABT4UVD7_9PSEU|nr:IclR family transcriptional regulator [Saccharopolyspora oryzae]MDA3625678.1 IclR family transcriptional regulator [Saccharopolyspora oryzae]
MSSRATRSEVDARAGAAPMGTQAIGRAMAVLRLFIDMKGDVRLHQVAEHLNLSTGTAHRILRALAAEGYVAQNPTTDSYYLGSRAVLLGQAAQQALGLDKALPVLEEINAATEESVNLAVREAGESVVFIRVQCTLPLRFEQHVGARFPLYSTASGKAMLAHAADAEDFVASLPAELPAVTAKTLRDPDKLVKELKSIRQRGYSLDDEENVLGVRCVGVPVLDDAGNAHAALVVQAPAVRMPRDRMHELGRYLAEPARKISRLIPVHHSLSRPATP